MPKISIIVPIYNAGERLRRCLDSLLGQTLRDIELILVTDCPTDGSDKVAEEYARRDDRVKLLRNERNLNISLSRNRGLEAATGRYIGFSDHDDYCLPRMYEALYEAAEAAGADAAVSKSCETDGKNNVVRGFKINGGGCGGLIDAEAFASGIIAGGSQPIWNHIYKRSSIGGLSFTDGASFEDGLFNAEFYLRGPRVVYVPEAFYFHVVHGRNQFGAYAYRSYKPTHTYLSGIISAVRDSGKGDKYEKPLAEGVFRRLYSCLLNELKHKGLCAACRLIGVVKKDPGLMSYVRLLNPKEVRLTLAKRVVVMVLRD